MFYVFTHKTNYASASPMNRITLIANDLKIDLFNFNSIESFNNYVKKHFWYLNMLIVLLLYYYYYYYCVICILLYVNV
jgi:hypothetical protein